MALVTKPNTFSAGTTILSAEVNSNFDILYNDYNGNITNANIAAGANIVDTKLAQITTASKVLASAITGSYTNINLTETTAPTTAASEGALYTKDTGGQPELFYREESDGDEVQLTTGGVVAGGRVIQQVNVLDNAVATGTTALPADDTIPQNTEGDEYMTLAITPTNASNILVIQCTVFGASSGGHPKAALFQDSTADALSAVGQDDGGANNTQVITWTYTMAAGTTSSTTFKIRAGGDSGTYTFNGVSGGRLYGGVAGSSMVITEVRV